MKSNICSPQKKHCTHTFTVILFLIAKIWEQPKQLSTDLKLWHVHNTECVCIVSLSCPGSSAPGIFPARILKCVAISYARGSSQPRDWTHLFLHLLPAGRFFIAEPRRLPWVPCLYCYCIAFSNKKEWTDTHYMWVNLRNLMLSLRSH